METEIEKVLLLFLFLCNINVGRAIIYRNSVIERERIREVLNTDCFLYNSNEATNLIVMDSFIST